MARRCRTTSPPVRTGRSIRPISSSRCSSAGSPVGSERMSIELSILIWLAIGIGIPAGVFVVARTAVQLATVAYKVIEKQMDTRTATRQTGLLSLAMLAALAATAVIAGYAILVVFASLLQSNVAGN